MYSLFISLLFVGISALLYNVPDQKWTKAISWSFYLAIAAASTFGAIGVVEILFK